MLPESAVGGREDIVKSESMRTVACISVVVVRSGSKPTPAAAMICGLSGLDDELARLPFREC